MIRPHTEKASSRPRRFPLFDRPIVAIDVDDTLCEYDGQYHPDRLGSPRPFAIWALRVFRANGYEIVLHTNRSNHDLLRTWADEHAPGLVDYINSHPKNAELGMNPGKPVADLFIDDRDTYFLGQPVDWIPLINRLAAAGYLPLGVVLEALDVPA
ncbi:HAD family hydrolase [bacterium]|nr:HAD family hydrolase [bacterium]